MKRETFAITVITLLLISASVIYAPYDSQGEGTADNPEMLSSSYSQFRALPAGETLIAHAGVNWDSFLNPSVTIECWMCNTVDAFKGADPSSKVLLMESNVPAENPQTCGAYTVSASSSIDGVFNLSVKAGSTASNPGYLKFKIVMSETVASVSTDDLHKQAHYCGIFLKTVAADEFKVMVRDTDDNYKDTIRIVPEAPYQTVVKIGTAYNHEDYIFYAEGLPDGINMKLDGVLQGKAAGNLMADAPEGDATLCAISKLDASEVHYGNLHYYLLPDDSFLYSVDVQGTEKHPCFQEGYITINSDQAVTVSLFETDGGEFETSKYSYTTSLSLSENPHEVIPLTDNTITLNDDYSLRSFSGIIQMHIVKTIDNETAYKCDLHILVIGPVVHSGLRPLIASE